MNAIAIVVIVLVALIVLIGLWFMGTHNTLVKLKNQVEEAFSTMDVYLKKRYDLIPNLVETVKAYAKHEGDTLEKVVAARNAAMGASSGNLDDKLAKENALSGTLKSLFAVAEAYPDLKSNTNFIDLQEQLKAVEEDIANARKYYNGSVKNLNNKVEMFPSSIVAGMFGFTKKPYFEVDSTEERQNVKVSFS
ncbi:LemA family protein [Eubacterium barkeri]|uniref:LemA protein n=1 Tax=Eubacterium barkeri TaxID=1528 RepID=A0A1H3FDS9_EUBBA|nr:LemA family protein [Eubacterium barkeri]SDX89162.1 LemA protein [Eubacterium barkeri]